MTWFKIDDTAHSHPKVLKAGNAAAGLWLRCGAYAAQHLTEGTVPGVVAQLYGTPAQSRKLVAAGLWHERGHHCPRCPQPAPGDFRMHDFLVYNPTRAKVEGERRKAADRQARGRERQAKAREDEANAHGFVDEPPSFGDESGSERDAFPGSAAGHGHPSHRDAPDPSRWSRPDPTRPADSGAGSRESAGRPARASGAAASSLPPSWEPDEQLLGWAMVAGHMQRLGPDGLDHATAKWKAYRADSAPRTPAQWAADWQQWVTRERLDEPAPAGPPRLRALPGGADSASSRSRADQHADALAAALADFTGQETTA
ncbi:mucin-2 [Streptomyces xanthochromogenes]|uniref:mucin-2 n=1 Tax=Streptomyces xanthochromogenes TaxID=67384 RepID=UPI003803AA67